ncbi:MAG TPA: hypothetical protein DCG57_21865 [Candidatus Riflebacteria bacterium]|nr:hypothetical protein [Candidatus Riflebacteria bacterium]
MDSFSLRNLQVAFPCDRHQQKIKDEKSLHIVNKSADKVSEIFSRFFMEATMVRQQTTAKGRWLLLIVLSLASIVFTGCEKGSLGIKGGSITGYVINSNNNQPIPDVLVKGISDTHVNTSTYSGGDGSFVMSDLTQGTWSLYVEKYGHALVSAESTGTQTANVVAATVHVANGETVTAQVIKMQKTQELVKGVLKGYPIDAVTGRPLTNFTVTQTYPYNQRKSKLFETAADFRDIGWSGLEGGDHHYTITANNYVEHSTSAGVDGAAGNYISIGASAVNLGTIKVEPLKVSIAGTLRNLPGYVLEVSASERDMVIWAEAAGKVVATFTDTATEGAYKGSITYRLSDIPVTAGSVSVKCKIRGYDLQTINQAVSLASNMPGGVIAGVDIDFANVEPIRRDLRIVVISTKPEDSKPASFKPGTTARVYLRQGGKDIVPYVDVVSVNYRAEAYFSGVITGYNLNVYAVNMQAGYYNVLSEPFKVQEDGNSVFTYNVQLKE